jgi:hypothetical protein
MEMDANLTLQSAIGLVSITFSKADVLEMGTSATTLRHRLGHHMARKAQAETSGAALPQTHALPSLA